MSEKGMWKLATDDLIPKVQNVHLVKCVDNLACKKNRTSFRPRPVRRLKALLKLVHTDDTKSHSGGQYFVNFIDNHSRKLWAYVLKTKDQVLSVFKELHARVERETGLKLKSVRADNGGEYRGQFEE